MGWHTPSRWVADQLLLDYGLTHEQFSNRLHALKDDYDLSGADPTKVWYDPVDNADNGDVRDELSGEIIGNVLHEPD
jgi:hypothetical protein